MLTNKSGGPPESAPSYSLTNGECGAPSVYLRYTAIPPYALPGLLTAMMMLAFFVPKSYAVGEQGTEACSHGYVAALRQRRRAAICFKVGEGIYA